MRSDLSHRGRGDTASQMLIPEFYIFGIPGSKPNAPSTHFATRSNR
jgi:hypothetical protein